MCPANATDDSRIKTMFIDGGEIDTTYAVK